MEENSGKIAANEEEEELCPECGDILVGHGECDNSKCIGVGGLIFCDHICEERERRRGGEIK